MKLTNVIIDLGRVVAYYPGLVKLTDSVTATVLLCQLLYWHGKNLPNSQGWIWKTADEITEETGLTYYEQKTAREKLIALNIIEFVFKRLDHSGCFRVNEDVLNNLWEDLNGVKTQQIVPPVDNTEEIMQGIRSLSEKRKAEIGKTEVRPETTEIKIDKRVPEKKGDWVDLQLQSQNLPGMELEKHKDNIKFRIEKSFKIKVTTNPKWKSFIDFVYTRERNFGENLDQFIKYALDNNYNPIYWSPDKMESLWPQAFIKKQGAEKPFIKELPKMEKQEYAPMPEEAKAKRNLT